MEVASKHLQGLHSNTARRVLLKQPGLRVLFIFAVLSMVNYSAIGYFKVVGNRETAHCKT